MNISMLIVNKKMYLKKAIQCWGIAIWYCEKQNQAISA